MAKGAYKRIILDGVGRNNPVFVQVLGICSTLAVTNRVANTLVMCLGLIFTTTCSGFTVSLLRRRTPARIRMMVEVMVIAAYVIIVDITLKATLPDISRQLGPYVGLIITNCIVMGRAEAFAMKNPPVPAAVDGLGAGLGYAYVLIVIAVFRELLGAGSLMGLRLLPEGWVNWSIMVMAPGAFFMLALFIWFIKAVVLKTGREESSK